MLMFPSPLFGKVEAAAAGDATVKLLLGFEGVDGTNIVTDESPAAHGDAIARGSAQIDTAQFKFGAASGLLFAGATHKFEWSDSDDWHFGSDDFTIEFWLRYSSVGNGGFVSQAIFSNNVSFYLQRWNANLEFGYTANGSTITVVQRAWAPVANTWYHIVAERSGSTFRLYVNGAMLGASASMTATLYNSTAPLHIGSVNNTPFAGWMDEVRITKGLARYASDSGYAVPTAAFPR